MTVKHQAAVALVLELHQPKRQVFFGGSGDVCKVCHLPYPCATVTAIQSALATPTPPGKCGHQRPGTSAVCVLETGHLHPYHQNVTDYWPRDNRCPSMDPEGIRQCSWEAGHDGDHRASSWVWDDRPPARCGAYDPRSGTSCDKFPTHTNDHASGQGDDGWLHEWHRCRRCGGSCKLGTVCLGRPTPPPSTSGQQHGMKPETGYLHGEGRNIP